MIAVQHISIIWDKADRGAAPATVRNALPRELPFTPPGSDRADWVHRVAFASHDCYLRLETWSQRAPDRNDGLSIRRVPNAVDIDIHLTRIGKIARPGLNGRIARLPFGKRLTVQLNGVHDGDHQRLYIEHVFHIAFADRATLGLPLHKLIDERVFLY